MIQSDQSRRNLLIVTILILVFILAGGLWFAVGKGGSSEQASISTSQIQKGTELSGLEDSEIRELLEKVGRHITIPANENPLVATIERVEKLKQEQAFYKDTQNGDKLIILMQKKQAIIYRPDSDKLVNVGPIVIDGSIQNIE